MELLLSPMHASRPRNRLIAQALYDMGVIEHYGRGIKRIKEECDRNGNPYPDWTDRPGEFLTIYKVSGGEEVQTGQHRELNEGNEGNREGKVLAGGWPNSTCRRHSRALESSRVLKQTGVEY